MRASTVMKVTNMSSEKRNNPASSQDPTNEADNTRKTFSCSKNHAREKVGIPCSIPRNWRRKGKEQDYEGMKQRDLIVWM